MPALGLAALAAATCLPGSGASARADPRGARDFEQALPAAESVTARAAHRAASDHAGEGAVTHRTGVIPAPARFDAVGLARELRPLEIRARNVNGRWGEWLEIANGDPAWVGGADELQLRTRGYRPSGNLHYVDVPAPAELAARTPPEPDFVSRSAWGANLGSGGCPPREPASYGRVKATVLHHTVGNNKYTEKEAPGLVLAICRYHRNALGWNDIGYNALVDRYGNIYAGRAGGLNKAVVGAQAQGVNAQTSGVAVMGTHTKKGVTVQTFRGLVRWLAWKLVQHGHTTAGRPLMVSAGGPSSRYDSGDRFRMPRIVGHRRTNLTECPGDALALQRKRLLQRVQARIDRYGKKDPGGGIGGP
jgi:hypothetical protein